MTKPLRVIPPVNPNVASKRLLVCLRCEHQAGRHCTRSGSMLPMHVINGLACPIGAFGNAMESGLHFIDGEYLSAEHYGRFTRWMNRKAVALRKVMAALRHKCDAPAKVIAERRDHCIACEHRTRKRLGDKCGKCGCFIALKTRIALERCPVKKWDPVDPERCPDSIARLYPKKKDCPTCGGKKNKREDA